MDILNDNTSEQPTSLLPMEDMVEIKPQNPIGPPEAAVRNRAATSAILSADPDKMVSKYQLMLQEAADGKTVTHDEVLASLAEQNRTKSMNHVINILGDRSIPLEQKKRLMNFVQEGQFKEEPAVSLQTKALASDNKGESIRGEAARISMATVMDEMQDERGRRQRMQNNLLASLPIAMDGQTVAGVAEAYVMPFGRNVIAANIAEKQKQAMGIPATLGGWIKDFLIPGSTKAEMQARLMAIPPENRDSATKSLLSSIKSSEAMFSEDNAFGKFDAAITLLSDTQISKTDVWMENVGTVLDAFWVGSEVRALGVAAKGARVAEAVSKVEPISGAGKARRPGSANPGVEDVVFSDVPVQLPGTHKRIGYTPDPEEAISRMRKEAPIRRENPSAPYNIMEQANPATAREMHKAMAAGTDEFAKAVTGVDKEQALINNIVPQVGTESGSVLNKVNQDVKDVLTNTGATRYTPEEFGQAVTGVQRDFREARGLQINDAMTTIKVDGDHLLIDAHFSTPGGAFTDANAAREQAKFALSDYGILDDEIVVMKRAGMDYVPVTGGEGPGDYIVKVKTKHAIDDSGIAEWSHLDVKRNFLDRVSQTGSDNYGAATGWLMDPGSMLHPTLTGSASIATDQAITFETVLLRPIAGLRSTIAKMPAARRAAVEEYMKEANTLGLKHDPFVLRARGFQPNEIKALKDWNNIWDGHYYLENFDMVRTLNSQGYQIFQNANTKLFAKGVPKNQNIGRVYDPATDTVVNLTKNEMDLLYSSGGGYAQLRRPTTINGEVVEHMMVRNTPGEHLRKVRDTDAVLNYREGYYTVNYKAPKFIDEFYVDPAGVERRRTVAVAGNTKDAEMFVQSQTAATGNRHVMREDTRGFRKDGDGYWDLNEASGRIAQRMRGKPLVDAVGINSLGVGAHIENPMESAVRSAKSLAGRTVSRPMLNTAKRRFVEQYGEFIQPNKFGLREFPANRSELVDVVSHTSSKIADARTTYGYIKFMEDGYINTADEIFKGGMNIIADLLGKQHLSTAERAARAIGDVAPTHMAKGAVFQAYIAWSLPFRQWLVQGHQVMQTIAYNPIGWATGKVSKHMIDFSITHVTPSTASKEAHAFRKFVDDSGMLAGVDRNSLARGMNLSMADSSSAMKRGVGAVMGLPQKAGFDIGEKLNMLGHLAAVYEGRTRRGISMLDKTQRDLAYTEARALSLDLNKAGELAYTQGTFASILQFLQMPHKSLLQMTNRKLDPALRARLVGWNLIMYGAPTALIGSMLTAAGEDGGDILPDDPDLRDVFVHGLEAWIINKELSALDDSGDQTRLDFGALKTYDMDGWVKMFHAFRDDGAMGALSASPAGQLLAVDGTGASRRNGRIPQAIITMGKFLNVLPEVDEMEPTEFSSVINDAMKITSGWSAVEKANLLMYTRKVTDAKGISVDSVVTAPEAIAAYAGFGTLATKELYDTSMKLQANRKAHNAKLDVAYNSLMTYYKEALGVDNPDIGHIQAVSSTILRSFPDPADLEYINKKWQQDMAGKEHGLFVRMAKESGLPGMDNMMDTIRKAPISQEEKDQIMGRIKDRQHAVDVNLPKGK